jgi:hypothetical protein
MAGLVPAIPIIGARQCPPKWEARNKCGHDGADLPLLKPSAMMQPPSKRVRFMQNGMQAGAGIVGPSSLPADDDILGFEVSDAALEAAANTAIPGAALSFPNAPTVSILIHCCSIDRP